MGGTGLPHEVSFKGLVGKRTLIRGNVRTGKTQLTVELLEEAVAQGLSREITVVDMAPVTEVFDGRSIGGRLSEFTDAFMRVRYLAPAVTLTPRLKARTPEELYTMVGNNAESIRPLLDRCIEDPSPVLFVNDVSIFLQSGSMQPVLRAAELAETFIANGYYGEHFSEDLGTGVSRLERDLMDRLASKMDVVISL